MKDNIINIGRFVECTNSEGPGLRFALFTQGCPIKCKSCCNPELIPFKGGIEMKCDDVISLVLESKKNNSIEGISFLGGEPTFQSRSINYLSKVLKENGLNILLYSGYYIEQIKKMYAYVLDNVDILIDGPFEEDKIITNVRYVGSKNQNIHFLTNEFDNRKHEFEKSNSFEVKFENGKIHMVGFAGLLLNMEQLMEKK